MDYSARHVDEICKIHMVRILKSAAFHFLFWIVAVDFTRSMYSSEICGESACVFAVDSEKFMVCGLTLILPFLFLFFLRPLLTMNKSKKHHNVDVRIQPLALSHVLL